jgi:hypothetical protein
MGVTEMKTYVLEVDGEPKLVFRAPDDQQAENSWASPPYGWQSVWPYNPKSTFVTRTATIPEMAAWRAHSVKMQEAATDGASFEPDWHCLVL